ncbi:MAG: YhjD/YihY/BrkB family envelope integrity protein, partial [Actinomycetota bacterium]
MARARRDDILLLAGGLAFYALVSVVPLVIVSLWVTGLLVPDDRIQSFADKLSAMAPKSIGVDEAVR